MSGFAGRRLRLEIDFGSGFEDIGEATSNSFTVNREPIDVTTKDDDGVRRYLAETGTFSLDTSFEGVLKDDRILTLAVDPTQTTLISARLLVASIGTITGDFYLTSFEDTGAEGAEALTFSASLGSSGTVTYAAAP